MPITLHFVRHAQGFHNLGPQYHSLRDPALTPLGETQCATLRSKLQSTYSIDPTAISLLTSSPLRRTIHTCALTFASMLTSKNTLILALPTAQETSSYPCDTGSAPSVLKTICREAGWPVDLTRVTADWTDKSAGSPYAPTNTKLAARARETRRILLQQAKILQAQNKDEESTRDIEIVLVTHGGLLHYLTEDWEGAVQGMGTGWANTELRSYNFVDEGKSEDAECHLVETPKSRKIRGKEGSMIPAGSVEQERLFREAMASWEGQGLETGVSVEREGENEDDCLERTMSQISREMEMGGLMVKAAA
jgi:broad specificity phosphatase PhoE